MRRTTGTQNLSKAVHKTLPLTFFKAEEQLSGELTAPLQPTTPSCAWPAESVELPWLCLALRGQGWQGWGAPQRVQVRLLGWWDRAFVSLRQDCQCRLSRTPALALRYLTSLPSKCIETCISKREVSGLIQGAFGFRV